MPQLLHPASTGELLDNAIGIARTQFMPSLRIAVPLYAVGYLASVPGRVLGQTPTWTIFGMILGFAVVAVTEVQLACASRDLLEGRPYGDTPVLPILKRRWAAIFFGYIFKWLFALIGFFFFFVPGIYLFALYFLVPCGSAFEDLGLREARARSRALARPHIWRLIVTIGLFDSAAFIFAFGALYLSGSGRVSEASELGQVLNWTIGLGAILIRGPLTAALYLDCRARSEGYDLERAALAIPAS